MSNEVRYCITSDGVRIAYSIEGDGPPLLVVPPIWAGFSLLHELPLYERFVRRIGEGRTLVLFDQRGVGLSQRDVDDVCVEAMGGDLLAVTDAVGLDRVSIIAGGPTGSFALEFATQNPERVSALVVFGTAAHVPDRNWSETMAMLFRGSWERGARNLAGANLRRSPEDAERIASIYIRSTSGELAARQMEDNLDFDLRPELSRITARTLVIHSQEDSAYPLAEGQEIAARIAGARLLPLEGNQAITSLGDKADLVADAVCAFLDDDAETRAMASSHRDGAAASGLRTVLFTDLVGHTEMMQRLGDEKGRDVLREHERITREVLKANGGTEVKTMGDGFMASFGSVTKAVECAVALQKAFDASEGERLSVRVGLNAGEPIEEDGDLFGATVILASRIAAKAEGGEILVADTVRGLCSGKGFLFSDRGEFVAKGVRGAGARVRSAVAGWLSRAFSMRRPATASASRIRPSGTDCR